MTAIDKYFEDVNWEDLVREKMKFVSDYPDEILTVISDAIEDHDMISNDKIKDAEQYDFFKLREERQDFDDWSAILDYDEAVGPYNRSNRINQWNPAINCGSLDDPYIEWRENFSQLSSDPAHSAEWGDICMMIMLHDRLEWAGWDIDDIIPKLHDTDQFRRQAQRRRFRK